jgi:Asp-tRNA(Asn)/Glu-tRNA(Gln) amidotransferase A subunit family amidase
MFPEGIGPIALTTVYLPSTVGPAGLTKSGLPVGYQAIAASGRDKTATAFSRLVERDRRLRSSTAC